MTKTKNSPTVLKNLLDTLENLKMLAHNANPAEKELLKALESLIASTLELEAQASELVIVEKNAQHHAPKRPVLKLVHSQTTEDQKV